MPDQRADTNFDRKGLTADDVETFFHEFGHVMHNTLSNTEFVSQGGTSVQRNFVEAPSQIYEEWAGRPETLALLEAHCKDCPELDAKTIQPLEDARNCGRRVPRPTGEQQSLLRRAAWLGCSREVKSPT